MKSSENKKLILPQNIKIALQKNLIDLKNILKDNPEFLSNLLNNCMLVGKKVNEEPIFFNDIRNLIEKEYPDYLKYEDGHKLLKNSQKIVDYICLNSELVRPLTFDQSWEFQKDFRISIEQEVINYLNSEDISLTGDSYEN